MASNSERTDGQGPMWVGPFRIEDLLKDVLTTNLPRPPEHHGVYVVSERPWKGQPATDTGVLYVGTTTGKSPRFRTRIGDLIADLFGFFCDQTGHSSGGQSLYEYCTTNKVHPFNLWIGWISEVPNRADVADHLFTTLEPRLNKKRPAKPRESVD